MPRARRTEQESNFRTRIGKLNNAAFPQDGTSKVNTQNSLDRHPPPINTTATEMSSGTFAPFLLGAANSVSSNSTRVELEGHGHTSTTSLQDDVVNNTLKPSLINDSKETARLSSRLPSFSQEDGDNPGRGLNDQAISSYTGFDNPLPRPAGLTGLVTNWGKKGDGLPVMDSAAFSPSWGQLFEKVGLSKAAAEYQSLIECSQSDPEKEIKDLRNEATIEKAARILVEQQLQSERQQRQLLEAQLENADSEKQELERRLQVSEQRQNELQATLVTAQHALEVTNHSNDSNCDWVLDRNEVTISENVIGIGGWGRVMEGTFRSCKVAVKQIHELILSPHNRRLFEREMTIASRCRHPCLLQFIGATNDDRSPLFVTELLDTSLRAVLHARTLEPVEITTLALDVAKALNYLHLNRPTPIIHRDISSANVLLWKHGTCWRGKVSDYGTANFMQLSMTIAPGAVVYSAPEALTSRQSPKVDVYSFGVLLCEMNIREFPDVTRRDEQVAMVTNPFHRDFIRRCLQVDLDERPSMEEIIASF